MSNRLKPSGGRQGHALLMGGSVLALLLAGASWLGVFRPLDERLQGRVMRLDARPWNPKLLMIEINENSLERLGWPIPRDQHAKLLSALAAAGAQVVGYDIFFVDPDPRNAESDLLFAKLARAYGRVAMPVEASGITSTTAPQIEQRLAAGGDNRALPWIAQARPPVAPLDESVQLSHVTFDPSASGSFRAIFESILLGGVIRQPLARVMAGLMNSPGVLAPQSGRHFIPTLRKAAGANTISFHRMLDGIDATSWTLEPELAARVKGKAVLIGQTAHSIGDHGALADGSVRPLLEVHAAMFQDLLEGVALREWPRVTQALAVFIVALLLALLATRLQSLYFILGCGLAFGGLWSFALLARSESLLPLASLSLAIALPAGAHFGLRLLLQERRERLIRQAFGAYVAPELLGRLLESPQEMLALQGKRKYLTILFSDIKGYTSLSNSLEAAALMELLKDYLDAMTQVVFAHEGRVDKIMGDGIMACFGDLMPLEDHARQAVRCGLAMHKRLQELVARWIQEGKEGLTIRVGIATGEVYAGNVGSAGHLEYTVLGPTVNLASRLESNAPPGGVLVSRETWEATTQDFNYRINPGLSLKGFAGGYDAFECLEELAESAKDRRRARRLLCGLPAKIEWPGGNTEGRLRELSAGGFSLEGFDGSLPALGATLSVQFSLFGEALGKGLVLEGAVRHRHSEAGDGPQGNDFLGAGADSIVGVELDNAKGGSRAALQNFVALFFDGAPHSLTGDGGRRYHFSEEQGLLRRSPEPGSLRSGPRGAGLPHCPEKVCYLKSK